MQRKCHELHRQCLKFAVQPTSRMHSMYVFKPAVGYVNACAADANFLLHQLLYILFLATRSATLSPTVRIQQYFRVHWCFRESSGCQDSSVLSASSV